MNETIYRGLARLARLYGVQTWYRDLGGERRQARPEALMAALRVLGAKVEGPDDIRAALRARRRELWDRALEPVAVAWDGEGAALELRRPSATAPAAALCRLELEDGSIREWRHDPGEPIDEAEIGGKRYVAHRLEVAGPLPYGYHRLVVEAIEGEFEARIISAPRRAHVPYRGGAMEWGVFMPLYALRTEAGWGSGAFGDLERLGDWVHDLGGGIVSTLPLLAAFLDEPYDPSPYSPVSRLFWNEVFVDPARAPGLDGCAAARRRLGSDALSREVEALRGAEEAVDYKSVYAARRSVLEPLSHCFFEAGGANDEAYRSFLDANPLAPDYARFRATVERHRASWYMWPERQKSGTLETGDYDEAIYRYHLYAQHAATQQLGSVARRFRDEGARLYLDLPLGTRPDGFDVWRYREVFAQGVSTGAPPDPFFSKGQSWGFPPLDPHRARADGWRYFIACIRNHLRYAGMLRLDHVMGLHRLFWIPPEMDASDGLYVRYAAEELWAILCLESRRHKAMIVGEDLGTVPNAVRNAMGRHGAQRMSVLQFEISPGEQPAVQPPKRSRVASVNTHDMPTWAAFWRGLDIEDRKDLGLLDDDEAEQEHRERERQRDALLRTFRSQGLLEGESDDALAVLRAALVHLGRSPARVVLATLEDLWGETRPQNTPGTWQERPNWRRKATLTFEEFSTDPRVVEALQALDAAREGE